MKLYRKKYYENVSISHRIDQRAEKNNFAIPPRGVKICYKPTLKFLIDNSIKKDNVFIKLSSIICKQDNLELYTTSPSEKTIGKISEHIKNDMINYLTKRNQKKNIKIENSNIDFINGIGCRFPQQYDKKAIITIYPKASNSSFKFFFPYIELKDDPFLGKPELWSIQLSLSIEYKLIQKSEKLNENYINICDFKKYLGI